MMTGKKKATNKTTATGKANDGKATRAAGAAKTRKKTGMKTTTGKRARQVAGSKPVGKGHRARSPQRQYNAAKSAQRSSSAAASTLTEARLLKMPARDYMSETQLDFFRQRLLDMRTEAEERLQASRERLLRHETAADETDRASLEEERWLELRLRERESVLINKVNQALRRIARHEYGYCEVTGEPIGLPRLLARPTATVCVDVKRDDEQRENHFL